MADSERSSIFNLKVVCFTSLVSLFSASSDYLVVHGSRPVSTSASYEICWLQASFSACSIPGDCRLATCSSRASVQSPNSIR